MSRLDHRLKKQLSEEEREGYEKTMLNLFDFIEPIHLTLKVELDKIILEKTSEQDFDCSNWAYKQAFYNGQIQTLKEVMKILSLKQK